MAAPSKPTTLAVRCDAVTKTFTTGSTKVTALRGIDLDVRQGELMMLVGPSGCGKTTLISVMAGILDHDGGECEVLGEDMRKLRGGRRVAFRGRNIGFVFQAYNLLPALTAAENVAVPLSILGVPRSRALARAKDALAQVGLEAKINALPSQLSGGQQQRVAIARAIVHQPRLIVCDEPTSALDHVTGKKVIELLRQAALADGRSLIIVTHDSRIFEYADRIAHLDDGLVESIEEGQHHATSSAKPHVYEVPHHVAVAPPPAQ